MMKSAAIVPVGLFIGLLSVGSAVADSEYSIVVKQTDFQSAEGVRALHQRIQRESRQACPTFAGHRSIRETAVCRREVLADLVSKINHPLLNAYVEGEDSLRIALTERRRTAERS
ncbi:MAG: UrcA family protein [Pseudomonadales bacterium]